MGDSPLVARAGFGKSLEETIELVALLELQRLLDLLFIIRVRFVRGELLLWFDLANLSLDHDRWFFGKRLLGDLLHLGALCLHHLVLHFEWAPKHIPKRNGIPRASRAV